MPRPSRQTLRAAGAARSAPTRARRPTPAGSTIELPVSLGCTLNGSRQELRLSGRICTAVPIQEVVVQDPDGVLGRTHFRPAGPGLEQPHSFAFTLARLAEPGTEWGLEVLVRQADGLEHRAAYVLMPEDGAAPVLSGPTVAGMDPGGRPAPVLLHPEAATLTAEGGLHVRGWVVAQEKLAGLSVVGELHGTVSLGLSRPDVAASRPDYPDAGLSGFELTAALEPEVLGAPMLLRATLASGVTHEVRILASPAEPPPSAPPEPGPVDPRRAVKLFCDAATLSADGVLTVVGWAISPTGILDVTVWLGEHCLGAAEFGFPREDVGEEHATIPMAGHSGFRGSFPVPEGFAPGTPLRLVARNGVGKAFAAEHAVEAAAAPERAAAEAQEIRLEIDSPPLADGFATEPVGGRLTIDGWAVCEAGITAIDVLIDGQVVGQALHGLVRQDVGRAFPGRPEALGSGYVFHCPPRLLRPGVREAELRVRAANGGVLARGFSFEVRAGEELASRASVRPWLSHVEADGYRLALQRLGAAPAFRLVLRTGPEPVDGALLALTLDALRGQVYRNWRVLIAAEAANLAALDGLNDRIDSLGSAADWPGDGLVGVLAPGDVLGADALAEIALAGALHPESELFYADELRPGPDGEVAAFHKPGYSPTLLLSSNYMGRAWFAGTALLRRAGIGPGMLAGGNEYDALLRCAELAGVVTHVPRLLFARGLAAEAPEAERAALDAAAARRGLAASVEPGRVPGSWRLRRTAKVPGTVSVIIPTCAAEGHIETCIRTLRATVGEALEIVCIENIPPERAQWREWLVANADVVVATTERFNWSRFNNLAATRASGDFLLFLNDDVEAEQAGWLDAMLEHAVRPGVGVVGARLLYPNRTVQHAGMFLGSGGIGRHAFRFAAEDEPGYFGLALTARDVSAVTGACMLMRRAHFETLGGFDEAHEVVNNDLDFCLRSGAAGRAVVYTPHATLIHHEQASRSVVTETYDVGLFHGRWGRRFAKGDPFHNPGLSTQHDDLRPNEEPIRVVHGGHPLFDPAEIRQILAVKLDHIGDFITAVPALRRLRTLFPAAEIRVLASPASRALAALEPGITEVLEFEFYHARSALGAKKLDAEEIEALRRRLAPYRFDLAIDLRKHPDTRSVLRASGARLLAGFDHAGQFPWLDIAVEWEGDRGLHPKRAHITDDLLHLVGAVATAGEADRGGLSAEAIAALRDAAPPPDGFQSFFRRPVVCLHPGAGNAMKQWPEEHFIALAGLLVHEAGANVLVIGGPDEAEIADRIAAAGDPVAVRSVAGIVPLRMLPALISRCALFVGNDSGPKHIAALVGVPTIGIHSGTVDPVEWAPLGPESVAVARAMACSPCYLNRVSDCPRALVCIRQIDPGVVFDLCRRRLPGVSQ